MADKITDTLRSTLGGAKASLGRAVGSEQLVADGVAQKTHAETHAANAQAQQQAQKNQQHAQGVADNVTGRVKSTMGAATGNTRMEAEGHVQQATGDVRRAANK